MRVLFSTGEPSGDSAAAEIAITLRGLRPDLEISAIGGPFLREAGAQIIVDSTKWAAIGIVEALRRAPGAYASLQTRIKPFLRRGEPGLFVALDYGAGNFRIVPHAKAAGWRIAWVNPPGSWRRDRQGPDLPRLCELVITPFPWSAEILRSMGADARFFGHPLARSGPGLPDSDRAGFGWLPGSRSHEIEALVPVMARSAARLPGPHFLSAARPEASDRLGRLWRRSGGPDARIEPGARPVLDRVRAAAVCSGTATLQAALSGCAFAAVYRGHWLMKLEYMIRRPQIEHMAMPNIVLQRRAAPELIQDEVEPGALSEQLLALAEPGGLRDAQAAAWSELRTILEGHDPVGRTAQALLDLAE
jgi:lipid-A-disaccharide synthase